MLDNWYILVHYGHVYTDPPPRSLPCPRTNPLDTRSPFLYLQPRHSGKPQEPTVARKPRNADTMSDTNVEAEAPSTDDTQEAGASGSLTITIQGEKFTIPAPYTEGHTLTANEASALNQLRAENIRNNAAGKIKKAAEAAAAANASFSIDAPQSEGGKSLRQEIDEYAEAYEFGTRQAGTRSSEPTDPVERQAVRIAKDMLTDALKNKGIKKAQLSDGQFDEMVKNLVAQRPEITDEAKRRVAQQEAIGAQALDLGNLTPAPSEPSE